MKHYGFTSAEVIGYLRIMRPGSVLGPQQFFLKQWERPMWAQGEAHRRGAPIQPYSGDSGYGKSSSTSPKAGGGAAAFVDSPITRPIGASSPVQQPAKKSPVMSSAASASAAASSPSLAANGSALQRQLLPGIPTSKSSASLTSSLGSMMLSTAAGSPSSYSPSAARPSASPPSPLMRSQSLQSLQSRFLSPSLYPPIPSEKLGYNDSCAHASQQTHLLQFLIELLSPALHSKFDTSETSGLTGAALPCSDTACAF